MNIVVIVSDTFRWDYLGSAGNDWIQTPRLDELAAQSVVFEDAYGEGIPTLPVRRVMFTGRRIFPFQAFKQHCRAQCHGWHGYYDEDVTLAEHLREQGYTGCLVNDVWHMMQPGMNFHRGYDSWFWIRGQEGDPYKLADRAAVDELATRAEGSRPIYEGAWPLRHLAVRKGWKSDADTPLAQVMQTAADWVRGYEMDKPFFLHVECFDPHEPWDPPLEWARLYDPDYDSLDGVVAAGHVEEMTPETYKNVKTAYAGEVSMVDHWVGRLLDTLAETGHADDTLVVFASDHGCLMGEQGDIHKGPNRLRNQVTRVPLMIRHPKLEGAGTRVRGFCQHQDIMPTILGLAGLPIPERVMGRDLWPQAQGNTDGVPETIVTAFGPVASVRTAKWNYIRTWLVNGEVYNEPRYHITEQLYDLQNDPQELTSVLPDHPDVAAELGQYLLAHVKEYAPQTTGTFYTPLDLGVDPDTYSLPPL